MVTLNKSPLVPAFGELAGDLPEKAYIKASRIGIAMKFIIKHFSDIDRRIRVLQYALMPDHLHLLLHVLEPTDEILGRIIARFKVMVNNEARFESVFEKHFNDQILKSSRSLDVLFNYIRDNARRLAVRKANPNFFRRVNCLKIGEGEYQAYGNMQLLDNPFKEQVVVHRADKPETRNHNRDLWLYTAANGGVLVSPFISPDEKAIRAEVEELDGRIILITNERFGERYKPAAHDFELCEQGRLLLISYPADGTALSRRDCMAMNAIAQKICSE